MQFLHLSLLFSKKIAGLGSKGAAHRSSPPKGKGPKAERRAGGGADVVGTAIDAEEEPVGLVGGDEIATAV